jgi:DNA-binding transcriptional LysR family regulator
MSQSAISLSVKSLEEKLSEPLFDRIGKKLVLNERGRLFYEQTRSHYLALRDAQNLFKGEKLSGILKIASSKTIGNFIIPEVVYLFLEKNPSIKIKKDIKNSSSIIKMVKAGEIDIGFIESECGERDVVYEKFASDRLVVVSSDETLSKGEFFIDELFSKRWLMREEGSGTRELFFQALGRVGEELSIFMEFSEFDEMKRVLKRDKSSIACISKLAVEEELKRGELFEVEIKNIEFERELFIVYHKDKYQSMLFRAFKDELKGVFG